jgi:hypothetical protein
MKNCEEINPITAFRIMRMLKNNLFFDSLNAFSIKVRMHILIQSHMHDLIKEGEIP